MIINISMTLHYGATWYQTHASAAKVRRLLGALGAVDCDAVVSGCWEDADSAAQGSPYMHTHLHPRSYPHLHFNLYPHYRSHSRTQFPSPPPFATSHMSPARLPPRSLLWTA